MAAAKIEQFPAPLDIGFVPQAGMPGLEHQLSCFRRTDHGLRIDRDAVLD